MTRMKNSVTLLGSYGGDKRHALSAWQSTEIAVAQGLIDLDVARRIEVLYEETVITKKRSPKDLLFFLAMHEHETPFEKSTLDFQLRGDIASHIHVIKHRIAVSVNSESARYKELKDKWYVPPDWEDKPIQSYSPPTVATEMLLRAGCKTWAEALDRYCWVGHQLYHQAVEELKEPLGRKRAKESARYFLPYAKQLDFDCMFNFRSFMHFLGLRGSTAAQFEIKDIAFDMVRQIAELPGRPFEWSLEAFGYDAELLRQMGANLDKEHEWK